MTFSMVTVEDVAAPVKAAIASGPFGSAIGRKFFVAEGVPVIRGNNLTLGKQRFVDDGFVFITEEKAQKHRACIVNPDDIVFTAAGSLGQVGIIPRYGKHTKYFISNKQLKLTPDTERFDPLFLYYWFSSAKVRDHFIASNRGAAVPLITLGVLRSTPVPAPPLPTQQRIAAILSAYDDLIENNTRRIAILEEMTRRLYEEWFVHFRFPGHQDAALDEDGPRKWKRGVLKDVVVLQRGFDLPKKARTPGPFPVFAATGKHGTHVHAKVKGPGVVTGRSGSLGTVVYIDEDFWPLNTTLWGKEFPLDSPIYAFFVLSSLDLASYNSGAAVPTLNRNDVHNLPLTLPEPDILRRFEEVVQPMFLQGRLMDRKNANLRAQRDLLLPKLVSGEIDVNVAEAALEAAE